MEFYGDIKDAYFTLKQGPISVSIYTPGDDYLTAVKAIFYYRQCLNTTLVRDFVTFHFYFPFAHMPNSTILTQPDLGKFVT